METGELATGTVLPQEQTVTRPKTTGSVPGVPTAGSNKLLVCRGDDFVGGRRWTGLGRSKWSQEEHA